MNDQLELIYECRICGELHLRRPAGEPVFGRPVVNVELPEPECECRCHLVVEPGLVPCPDCGQ